MKLTRFDYSESKDSLSESSTIDKIIDGHVNPYFTEDELNSFKSDWRNNHNLGSVLDPSDVEEPPESPAWDIMDSCYEFNGEFNYDKFEAEYYRYLKSINSYKIRPQDSSLKSWMNNRANEREAQKKHDAELDRRLKDEDTARFLRNYDSKVLNSMEPSSRKEYARRLNLSTNVDFEKVV